ncbi:type I polyketide synthase [Hyella patelloides]|nr:polyketide synthase [Hyella patelloides]
MRDKIDTLEKAKHEPIAIIGIGCRFPGADNPEEFWQLLSQGGNAITKVPEVHWDLKQYCSDAVNTPGKICTAYGGFVPHLKEFDAAFFRIAPREAISLDPQQRLLLEVSWEALENAAIPAEELKGTATGVFIGICGTDYWHQLLNRNPNQIDAYLTTGNTHSLASGRLSHFYGLTAPSISLDTACSSSLVAVHLAIKSLRDRESNLAIVGGVNRLIAPQVSINFSQAKMLSPDGLCKTFDTSANGFVRSEGCGIVILKRLDDAIADRDNIQAVLLGSAVNQDGRTSSITTPNSLSQQAVIKQALKNSKIKPSQVSYVESHGTGTSLGDLIEIEALSSVFAYNEQLILGAVKTNIGHLESASGIASSIKTVLSLQKSTIPANLHLKQPHNQIDWQKSPFILPKNNLSWEKKEQPRIAGVSAFGLSGTNAHVIISEAPDMEDSHTVIRPDSNLFSLSARNKPALQQLVTNYTEYLEKNPHLNLEDICLTVNIGRSHFNHRLALTASSTLELQSKLRQFINQKTPTEFWQGKVNLNSEPKVTVINSPEVQKPLLDLAASMLINPVADLDVAKICWEINDQSSLQSNENQTVIFTKINHELDDWQLLTSGLAQLYILGVAINWQTVAKNFGGNRITLPTYPFQRQTYWWD